jgi:PAS domain S-box-containing protein
LAPADSFSYGRRIWSCFALAVASLIVVAVLGIHSTRSLISLDSWVAHTWNVHDQLQALGFTAKSLQSDLLSYAATGSESFLDSARSESDALPEDVDHLSKLVGDNPSQVHRLTALSALVHARREVADQGIAIGAKRGFSEAAAAIRSGPGLRLTDQIARQVEEMSAAEFRLLASRQIAAQLAGRKSIVLIGSGSLFAALFVGFAGVFIAQALADARQVNEKLGLGEQQMRHLNQELDASTKQRITDLGTSDQALQRQTKLLQTILESMGEGVIVRAKDGRLLLCNTAAHRILPGNAFGSDSKFDSFMSDYEILPDEFGNATPLTEIPLSLAMAGVQVDDVKLYLLRRSSGDILCLELSGRPLYDGTGTLFGGMVVFRDISDRKRVEVEQARLAAVVQYSSDAIISVTPDGLITSFNPGAERLYGYTADQAIGQSFSMLESPEKAGETSRLTKESFDQRHSVRTETTRMRKDGRIFDADVTDSPIYDRIGRHIGFSMIARDVSERKLSERELAERKQSEQRLDVALREAQAAVRAKGEFLAIMSHEIRTPMNGVIGTTSILAETDLTDMQRDCVNIISSSGESLLAIINDILDYSKIESGKLLLEHRPFILQQCVQDSLDLFASPIRIKHLEAGYIINPGVPSGLVGDATRLRQILVNIIGNAVKFTSGGEIVIEVACQKLDENGCHLLFSITDTGIGISKESIGKLFQAFQQGDTSTTRRYGGTGLGLIISKRLAESMGGSMWVESEFGVGSSFFFSVVMVAASEAVGDESSAPSALHNLHSVLIVDDNTANRRIVESWLNLWGVSSTSVSSGREALEELSEKSFAVALIDSEMPEMDGLTLAHRVRSKGVQIPLILLSSSGEAVIGKQANLFQSQISKPVNPLHLLRALQRITGIEQEPLRKALETRIDGNMAATHPLRILIAEDNPVNRKVALMMLSRLGYSADSVVNGLEAVETMGKARYDLILMDIQMPIMNGTDAAHKIQKKTRCFMS